MRPLVAALALIVATTAGPADAQDALPPAAYAYTQIADPAKEAAARELMLSLRCLVCQGQSIADSDAPMAGDMRHAVRTRIAAGEAPDAVRAWLVSRYGEWVSYDPPLSGRTWPLFVLPLLVVLGAGALAARRLRA